jgi:hypothetical protein
MRRAARRSVLLFLTDRCPVGCAHCSVDSRRDSPTIVDFHLFERLIEGICNLEEVQVVGISGGEPFVERRGLTLAADRLSRAGKVIVLYTSGVWAGRSISAWIRTTLRAASCVFLSTDGYHASVLPDDRFIRAARAIRNEGISLVVQVIRMPKMVAAAERLLEQAFGDGWRLEAELSLTTPLPYGRGANVFHRRSRVLGRDFGPCPALAAPVVRYDGHVTACCNEQIIMGRGPGRLRRQCADGRDLGEALDRWSDDPLLESIAAVGPGPLTEHPDLLDLREERFGSICDLCWKTLERMSEEESRADPILRSTTRLGTAFVGER